VKRPAFLLVVQAVTVFALLVCVVILAALHHWRLDLTPERRFTISPHTREVLAALTDDVDITVFFSSQEGAIRREMTDLLGLYHDAQPRVRVRLLDLDRSPGLAKQLGISAYNTGLVVAGERHERLELVNEDVVTGAILAVAGTPPVVTYFVVGHGEHDPRDTNERSGASEAARALAAEGFRLRALEGAAVIPEDAGLVVLAGPIRDLSAAEADALAGYVARGGNLLLLCDPGTPPAVRDLAARLGVELANDSVVDEQGRLFGTDGMAARVAYLNQSLVIDASGVGALLPTAQSLRLVDRPGVRADYLATTAESSWADVDRRAGSAPPPFRAGRDRRGPLPIAAVVRPAEADRPGGRVVVIGDADFASNLYLNVLGNRDLLLATAELATRAEASAAARPTGPPGGTFSSLNLTAAEARFIFWAVVVAPSALAAAAGILVARRRRFA
jgi:hypothetical protein